MLDATSDPGSLAPARRDARTLAVLDPAAGTLTAVRPGTVAVTVSAGGLTTSKTVTLPPR